MVERTAQETLSHFYTYNQTPEMNHNAMKLQLASLELC